MSFRIDVTNFMSPTANGAEDEHYIRKHVSVASSSQSQRRNEGKEEHFRRFDLVSNMRLLGRVRMEELE